MPILRPSMPCPSTILSTSRVSPFTTTCLRTFTHRLRPQVYHSATLFRSGVAHRTMASAHTRTDSGACTTQDQPQINFSSSEAEGDKKQLTAEVEALVSQERGGRRWVLLPGGNGVERVVRFKTFAKAWAFMDKVAAKCKETRHHPEWTNIYNKTHIVWTTHSPPGLSSKDIIMAKYCDEAAAEAGEVEPTEDQARDDERLFTSTRMEANECCTR